MKDKKITLIVCLIAVFVVIQFFFMKPEEKKEIPNQNTETTIQTETASSTTPELE
jgi:preprotein translocase subunit YajC